MAPRIERFLSAAPSVPSRKDCRSRPRRVKGKLAALVLFAPLAAWPRLDTFAFDGLRRSDAAALRAKLERARVFEIRGAKSDAWIAANADNPFRDWVDRDERAGKRACAAYRKAFRALARLDGASADGASVDGARPILEAFVAAFNNIDATLGLDTVDREEVYAAFCALIDAKAAGLNHDRADRWFDAWREF